MFAVWRAKLRKLKEWAKRVKAKRRHVQGAPQVAVAVCCSWGKHRSVGAAWLLWKLFQRLAARFGSPDAVVSGCKHLCEEKWAACSCGRNPCWECDMESHALKEQAIEQLARWWLEV